MKNVKHLYSAPCVLRQVKTCLEADMLVASIVDKAAPIESKGQDVVQYDYSQASTYNFNHTWEDQP